MARCFTPFDMRHKITGEWMRLPCGKCENCVKRRASEWSFRLMQEEKKCTSAYFITLTYDTKHCNITRRGYMGLCKRDVQLFYKRLRKCNPESRIKYYTVGEYGGKTNRPHYHAILFNAALPTIQKAWQLGSVHYGTVSGASIGYCLKYMSKKGKIPMHKNDDRLKEFALMSKGLGACYLTDKVIRWHKADLENRMYVNIEGGKKASMARYYKDRLYTEEERKRVAFFQQIAMVAKEEEERIAGGEMYEHERAQSILQSFKRMRYSKQLQLL